MSAASQRRLHAAKTWTVDEIKALGVRTDLVTACAILYGCGKNRAWEMYHAGELAFPTLKVGRRVVVPTSHLHRLLGIEESVAA